MPKGLKLFLLVLWSVIAVAAAGFFFYCMKGGAKLAQFSFFGPFNISGWKNVTLVESYNNTFAAADIQKINVDFSAADISVTTGDTDSIRVVVKTADSDSEKKAVSVTNENDVLTVAKKETRGLGWLFRRSSAVEIELPKTYSNDLAFSVPTGDIRFTGDYSLNSLSASESTGDFTADSLCAKTLDLNGSTGDVNIGSVDAQNCTISRSTGDVTIRGFAGSGSIRSHTGDVTVSLTRLDGGTDISTSTGDVTVSMPKTIGAQLYATTSLGDIQSDLSIQSSGEIRKKSLSGQIGSGPFQKLDVSTSLGDINLKEN